MYGYSTFFFFFWKAVSMVFYFPSWMERILGKEILGKVITSIRRSAVTLNILYSIEFYSSTSENWKFTGVINIRAYASPLQNESVLSRIAVTVYVPFSWSGHGQRVHIKNTSVCIQSAQCIGRHPGKGWLSAYAFGADLYFWSGHLPIVSEHVTMWTGLLLL